VKNKLLEALCDVVRLCERLAIPYAVMGGLAVRVYGITRPTYDVDLTISLARERLVEFYDALDELGYAVPDAYRAGWVDQVADMPLVKVRLYATEESVDVDIFLAESPFQRTILERRRHAQVESFGMWLVSPEDLILLKLIAGRHRDWSDIGDVIFMQGELDEPYMRQWADRLGVREKLEQALIEAKNGPI
jgi:hypothetical protein